MAQPSLGSQPGLGARKKRRGLDQKTLVDARPDLA